MDKLSKERLLKVAELLENLPREKRFSLGEWQTGHGCRTTACAVGWASRDPWFVRRGLRLKENTYGAYPEYRGEDGFAAARSFFRINSDDVHYLFDERCYGSPASRTRKNVARRIRQFVAEQEKRNG